jgi:hypothetical protein
MSVLLFPSDDVLRQVLAAGVIPPAVAAAPVAAGFDDAGRVWAGTPPGATRDGLAALHRFGVRVLGTAGPPTQTFSCWHQLLPLRPAAAPATGPMLLDVPDDQLARATAAARRLSPGPVVVRLLHAGRAWIVLPALPPTLAARFADDGAAVYSPHGPGVWVRYGWEQPLAAAIRPADGVSVVIDPQRVWRFVPNDIVYRPHAEYRIGPTTSIPAAAETPLPRIPVPFTLRPRRAPAREDAWVVHGDGRFEAFLRAADGRVLRDLRVAVVAGPDGGRRFVVRPAKDRAVAAFPVSPADGYATHPGLPGLLIPAAFTLGPAVRRDRLAAAVGLTAGGLVWIESDASGSVSYHRTTVVRFRPAAEFVEYVAPPTTRLAPAWGRQSPLAFDPIGPVVDPPPDQVEPPHTGRHAGEGWFTRSVDRLSNTIRRVRTRRPAPPPPTAAPDPPAVPGRTATTDDVVHQVPHDRSARRAELEHQLIHQLPHMTGGGRADLWAAAAELAAAESQHADAGLCWANAVWEADRPPANWYGEWLRAELRLAKVPHAPTALGDWLALTPRRVPPRLVAAYLAWCGSQRDPPADISVRLPGFVAQLDDRADKLPVRAGWLARLAAAGLAGGDPLGLARWRDVAFRRLAEAGPALDLDAPTFVRFHGRPGGDRFRAARDWLLHMREPAHRWLARQASPRGLNYFGLDPETDATAGYLDLMFAWGAGRLGERNAGRDWEEAAAGVLARPPGAGDAGVHAVLLAAFRHRIRDAQHGRPDRPGLPADVLPAYHQLTDFQRYAVDQLRRVSTILEPVDRVNPYQWKDSADALGDDPLGRRLRKLATAAADELDREVRALLALPDPEVLPRVTLAAVAVAPRLPADTALAVLGRVPIAVRLAPASAWASRSAADLPHARLEDALGSALDAAAHAACVFGTPDVVRDLVRHLTGPTAPPAPIPQAALGPIAGRFFRALRRLGLTAEAEAILARVGPAADDPVARVGFAVGWLAAGNEDAAVRLLDEARERLFAVGFGPPPLKSKLAVAYAAALAHAPYRLALGRLEEVLLRLDGAWAHGSANRYFTPSALGLIDAIVRAVAGDDSAPGPEVRGWLDDAEFGTRRRITRDLDAVLADCGP